MMGDVFYRGSYVESTAIEHRPTHGYLAIGIIYSIYGTCFWIFEYSINNVYTDILF